MVREGEHCIPSPFPLSHLPFLLPGSQVINSFGPQAVKAVALLLLLSGLSEAAPQTGHTTDSPLLSLQLATSEIKLESKKTNEILRKIERKGYWRGWQRWSFYEIAVELRIGMMLSWRHLLCLCCEMLHSFFLANPIFGCLCFPCHMCMCFLSICFYNCCASDRFSKIDFEKEEDEFMVLYAEDIARHELEAEEAEWALRASNYF